MLAYLLAFLTAALPVSGTVRHALNRDPLAGVVVTASDGATSVTDSLGRFTLDVSLPARLRFDRAGYTHAEIEVTADAAIEVMLTPAAHALEAVMVTALRGEASVPISRSILRKEELTERYFGQEVPYILAAEPSITTYSDAGSFAGYSYMRLRGIDQTRINITLDGVPLNDPEDQVLYFQNFADFGNSIESVQIQRGVGTSSNGTASYAGAISFESIALATAPRRGELQLSRGSFDSNRASLEYQSGLLADRFALYGRFSTQQTDGFRHNSANRSRSAFMSAGYFGERNIAKLTAFAGVAHNQLAYLASSIEDIRLDPRSNPLSESERDGFSQRFAALTYTRVLTTLSSMSVTGYASFAGGDYDVRVDDDLYNFNLASRWFGAIGNWTQTLGAARLIVGTHANIYERDHFLALRPELARLYFNTGQKDEVSGFAKVSYDIGAFTLFGDAQLRHARFSYEPDRDAGVSAREMDWTFVNPKGGVVYRAGPRTTLYASYGGNSREPTRNDMFAGFDNIDTSNVAFVGQPDRVRPESVRDLELGLDASGTIMTVHANLFAMNFRNEITPVGELSYIGLPLRKNVAASYRRGVELDLVYRGVPRLVATLNGTFSRNRVREYTDDATGETFRDVEPLLTPRVLTAQTLRYALTPTVSVAVEGRYIGESFLDNTSNARFTVPASYLLDGGVTWRLGRGARHELLVRANNLTNRRVFTGGYTDRETSYYYLQADRNVFVTAKLVF